jgi:hypothetical protein
MTLFTVYRVTNNWNRRGQRVNVQETVVSVVDSALKAAKIRSETEVQSSWGRPLTIHAEVRDATGAKLSCFDLYSLVVGHDVVAAQEADPDFSINLDTYFRDAA